MSNVEDSEYVGKNHPPRKHRFSSTNQPARRPRRRKGRDTGPDRSIAEELLEHLAAPVTVRSEGKATEAPLMTAFLLRLIRSSTEGSMTDQLRFLDFLRRHGLLETYDLQARLAREAQDLREEHRASAKSWTDCIFRFAEYGDGALNVAIDCAHVLKAAYSKCSCGCFQNPSGDQAKEYIEWLAWAEEQFLNDDEQQRSPNSRQNGQGSEPADLLPPFKIIKKSSHGDDDINNEFYKGQLGQD